MDIDKNVFNTELYSKIKTFNYFFWFYQSNRLLAI